MKIRRTLLIVFAVLPLIAAIIALFFMPEQIPAHYGADFTVDRYGSKYEVLIFPAIILVVGLTFLIPAALTGSEANKKLILNIGLGMTLFFDVLSFYILYMQATGARDMKSGPFSFERFLLLCFGAFFIFFGNLLPMTRRNSFIGLRTKWSMKNDTVWKKSQLFGGISMIILGVVLFVLAFTFPNIFLMIVLLIAVAIADTVYTYFAAKKYGDAADE